MVRIALTGAAGNVGREIVDAFGPGHEVVPFTHSETAAVDSELLDVTDADDVLEKLDGVDVVVHLAGASSPDADWETVSATNVQGTKHVLDAVVEHGIDRVVFASSNHAVGAYNATGGGPETVTTSRTDTRPVRGDAPTAPDSFYGASKAACEALTKLYAERHDVEVVNLRIGWYMSEDDLREAAGGDADPERARFARATWLSPRDCRAVHRQAATADLPESPVTVNAVSRNGERYFTLTETMQALDYRPRDDAAEVLED